MLTLSALKTASSGQRLGSRAARVGAGALLLTLVAWLLAWAVAAGLGPQVQGVRVANPSTSTPVPDVRIAPRGQALSFARWMQGGRMEVLLVSAMAGGQVRGLPLTRHFNELPADPLAIFGKAGYERLRDLQGEEIGVPVDALVTPFEGTAAQVAAGINYPEHGREVALDESFLFPKLTRPAHFRGKVGTHGGLLDHEVELGFLALAPLAAGEPPRHVGLVLVSDYTDRAELLRGIDLADVSSGRGFTQAKSQPDFMPIGNLLVIPADPGVYVRGLELRLWVNGKLRQLAEPRLLVWDWPRILAETFARQDRRWAAGGRAVSLPLVEGRVPAGTIFLSGTPQGVVFQAPSLRQKFLGVSERVFTGQWSTPHALIEPLIRESYSAGIYLQPRDQVLMLADGLGFISNEIVDGAGPVPNVAAR